MPKKSILWVILLSLISGCVVFYRFNQIPASLTFDEIEFARLAVSLYNEPYSVYSTYATGHTTLYYYGLLTSFLAFGLNSFALRLPSAIFGFIAPIIFFFVIKEAFEKLFSEKKTFSISIDSMSFFLAILLLTHRWYFSFARFSFEATFLFMLELFSLYFLLRFLKTKMTQDAIGAGLFAGLTYNSYLPGRIYFILPLLFIALWSYKKSNWKPLAGFLITLLLITAPLNLHLLKSHDIRFQQQSFMHNPELSLGTKVSYIITNAISSQAMFFYPGKGDSHGIHNYPYRHALNPIVNILFWSGLLLAITKYRRNTYMQIFLLYYALSILPTIFTYPWENPNMLRMYTALAPIIFMCGLSLHTLATRIGKKHALAVVIVLVGLSAIYEIRSYYVFMPRVYEQSFETKDQLNGIEIPYWEKLYLNQ